MSTPVVRVSNVEVLYSRDLSRAWAESSSGWSHSSPSITSQATTSAMEAIVAIVRRHHDREPASSHTVELIVATAPVARAATSADFSPGTSSHGRLASTMPRSSRQRPVMRGRGTRCSSCGGGVGHATDEGAHGVPGAGVHPQPAQRGQRQHRCPSLRVGLDQQVAAVVVAKRKLGQADDKVPFVLASMVVQPRHRGVDILRTGGERLAYHLDIPGAAIFTAGDRGC